MRFCSQSRETEKGVVVTSAGPERPLNVALFATGYVIAT